MAPPGLLWTWYDDRNQVEAAIQIARVWFNFATNGVDPWAEERINVTMRLTDVLRVRKQMKVEMRHRLRDEQRARLTLVMDPVIDNEFPARGAENFVESIILRWRFMDAMDMVSDMRRRVTPSAAAPAPSRRVRQAFEAIIVADEVPTAYVYLGADPEWWAPEPTRYPF